MRQVRPVMGLVRISIIRSAILPDGSTNVAETDWLSNISLEGSAGGIMLILRVVINAVGETKLMLKTGMRRMPAIIRNAENLKKRDHQKCLRNRSDDPAGHAGAGGTGPAKASPGGQHRPYQNAYPGLIQKPRFRCDFLL